MAILAHEHVNRTQRSLVSSCHVFWMCSEYPPCNFLMFWSFLSLLFRARTCWVRQRLAGLVVNSMARKDGFLRTMWLCCLCHILRWLQWQCLRLLSRQGCSLLTLPHRSSRLLLVAIGAHWWTEIPTLYLQLYHRHHHQRLVQAHINMYSRMSLIRPLRDRAHVG